MDAKQIIEAFVRAIDSPDSASLESLTAPDFARHSIAAGDPRVQRRSDLLVFLCSEFEIFSNARETILDIFAQGEKVAVRHSFRGTQHGRMGSYPPTGKSMNPEYIAIYRVRNRQLVEAWAEWDNLAGLRRLGQL
jgi:predicted ester cyclase